MALIFTWLRLSSMRQLDWYRNSNYQSKDIAHVQQSIAQKMADKARSAKDARCRVYARMALEGLPRGGGNGDDIRMGILGIMRNNGIKEGHRPGIDEKFLEQWHQKLHTNTTPDDIAICSAYLAFLHSNDGGEFWRVLWDMAKLTPEDLANFDKPITAFPMHLPHLIDPFKHYLWLLKVTHSGADLDTAAVMAQGFMDDDLAWNVFDILANRNEWWVPGKIVEVRSRLAHYWQAPGATRDLLMLDLALESWFRLLVERTDLGALQGDDHMALISLVLRNTIVGVHDEELSSVVDQWEWLQQGAGCESGRWSREWAMAGLASLQRAELALAQYMDTMYAEALQPIMREAAGVSSWQVVSQGQGVLSGVLTPTASLADVQGKSFAEGAPTLLLAEHVGGNEDIPEGIQAVITRSATDVLSHAAIRARAQQVLLATCNDAAQWEGLQALAAEGKSASKAVTLSVTPEGDVRGVLGGDLALEAAKVGASDPAAAAAANGAPKRLQRPRPSSKWALQVAKAIASGLQGVEAASATASGDLTKALQGLASLRHLVSTQLKAPEALVQECASVAAAQGLIPNAGLWAVGSPGWKQAWSAICRVWASKWNDRAWLNRRALKLPDDDLVMGVLLQQVVPADYAYVLHTANPVTGTPGQAFGEAVVGMGEALVGNYPGRALSFTAPLDGTAPPSILSLPAKRIALRAPISWAGSNGAKSNGAGTIGAGANGAGAPLLIARSDANGEDLEDLAGAGLYDSIPFSPLEETVVGYANEPLMTDPAFRARIMSQLTDVAKVVKGAYKGQEQDIEGVISQGQVWVVQSRPQVIS
ncbi:glutathione synthetase ATP-binding domain-like protein [Dunaliella salina]|uniref:Glutathione synthetase ATP-binding domain-like protein n=1 Tax=Dunaliella salina TaxID=3046 RepID=A0ABQ7GBD5_DUNSA|nr:glutathione synthetase ATP-binding domain-like protein [Dunaliella salina]|eukprot:KAF5831865.1 glutathione synthetase ATP-binding domain-like protein [Dunaliella salina]